MNQKVTEQLRRYVLNNPTIGILIVGNYRSTFGIEMDVARQILCKEKGEEDCHCSSCRIFPEKHPDFYELFGAELHAEQIREILKKSNHYGAVSERKVVLLKNADRLNLVCANAILKVLEEGQDRVLFVMTASSEEGVLETIRSRVRIYRFLNYDENGMKEWCVRLGAKYQRPLYLATGGNVDWYPIVDQERSFFEEAEQRIREIILGNGDAEGFLSFLHLLKEKDKKEFFTFKRECVYPFLTMVESIAYEEMVKEPKRAEYLSAVMRDARDLKEKLIQKKMNKDDFFFFVIRVLV